MLRIILFIFLLVNAVGIKAQQPETLLFADKLTDSSMSTSIKKETKEIDLPDIYRMIVKSKEKSNTTSPKQKKVLISALPAFGYSLQTKFAVLGVVNAAFYTSKARKENISSILANVTYTQNAQLLLPILSNIWSEGNKYNLITDWRYLKYPSITYGLGGNTKSQDGYLMDYSYLRFYQTLLRSIAPNLYAGLGYNLDYFWNIREINPPANKQTDLEKYGLTKKEIASGVTANVSYDNRKNSINPEKGYFARLAYRPNFAFLGSNTNNWESLTIDLRTYVKLPGKSKNVLAFWNYNWLTTGGNPPYLLLPSTGWDVNNNSGRGYIQGRFRGKDMIYLETEYRFRILNNGLIGGVLFLNAQSVTDQNTNSFQHVYPGWGTGIRIKVNKYSRTNIAIDYGFGVNGSRGFFINLGEIF